MMIIYNLCPGYDYKLMLIQMFQVWILLLLPGSLWLEVVVLVRMASVGQIELLKNYSYLIEPCAKTKI